MNPLPRLTRWALAASVASAVGCAAGARNAPSSRTPVFEPEGPTPTTIDEAVADVDRWRLVLGIPESNAASGRSGGAAAATPYAAPPPPPEAAPPPTTLAPPADATTESKSVVSQSDSASAGPPPECVTPCKAIASMRRSVDALCRLAGDRDARCMDARGTLARSEQRVARCGC